MGAEEIDSYRVMVMSGSSPALKPFRNMIYSNWLVSLRYGNDWFTLIDGDRYYAVYEQVIDALLARRDSAVRLAVLSDDEDLCLGWSLCEGDKLHYVFVKKDQRNQGIAKNLLPKTFNQVTHLTRVGEIIRKRKFKDVIFDPFLT